MGLYGEGSLPWPGFVHAEAAPLEASMTCQGLSLVMAELGPEPQDPNLWCSPPGRSSDPNGFIRSGY